MKILVFGASGMIGHQMWYKLNKEFPGMVYGTVRQSANHYDRFKIFDSKFLIPNLDVTDFSKVLQVLEQVKPDVVLNCVGITLRKPEIKNFELTLEVNSLFPQRLGRWAAQHQKRLIHFSTDCVFAGSDGMYTEVSIPDAQDVYGKTKFLGEVLGNYSLTLRCPIVGREIEGKTELIEWFLKQKNNKITGYAKAIYSGITSAEMARQIILILRKFPNLTGLYQISSEPISKYELLKLLNQISTTGASIDKDESYSTNKSLDSKKYRQLTGYVPPSWGAMLTEMMEEKLYNA
ncbi:MAG: SDR family oxidoreductase [Bdellovibrionota bacterium]